MSKEFIEDEDYFSLKDINSLESDFNSFVHNFENDNYTGHNSDFVVRAIYNPDEWEEILIGAFDRQIDTILEKETNIESYSGVFFHKGYLIATNGHILIKQNLEKYGFLPHHIKAIEGKFILTSAFEKIRGFDLMDIRPDKIVCYTASLKTKAEFFYHKLEKSYPDYEKILEKQEIVGGIEKIGLNFQKLKKISPLLLEKNGSAEFGFTGENKTVFLKSIGYEWYDETILLMPIVLDKEEDY